MQIPKSHQNELKSKVNLESVLTHFNMRLAFPWSDNDYGIDGQIELISPIRNSESFKVDSKFFMIQLKSSEHLKSSKDNVSFPILVKKILQWYTANLPVMLLINDLREAIFYMVWIDERLINELDAININWTNQETVTLKIPKSSCLNKHTSEDIRSYVFNWQIPNKKIIPPGIFYELQKDCFNCIEQFGNIIEPFQLQSSTNNYHHLKKKIDLSIYRVAITGLSRVGKSSLINAMLRRQGVSPTGIYQTTGVPIQIGPSEEDKVVITYHDGRQQFEKFSPNVIAQYASQSLNEDNCKNVKIVNIGLANVLLAKGISLYDIPGLDDPSDEILNYTWNTIRKANAILYLIDASPFENGGYIFKKEYKEHILELSQSLDKVFLVFTKVNALTGNKLSLLKERVSADLKKLNLHQQVASKIYFVSAEESLNARIGKKKYKDTVQILEEDLLSYVLNENKSGLSNLQFVNKEISKALEDFDGLLDARLMDISKRKELESIITTIRAKIPELSKIYYEREDIIRKSLQHSIDNKKNTFLSKLEAYMKSIPLQSDIPNKKELQRYMLQGCYKTLEDVNKEYTHQINLQQQMIDSWILENLKEVKEIISTQQDTKIVDFSEIDNFTVPSVDLSGTFGASLLVTVVTLFINPPAAIFAGITSFFGSLLMSASEKRAERITKIMHEARKLCNDQYLKISKAYLEVIDKNSDVIIEYAEDKIEFYFKDIETQTGILSKAIIVSNEDKYMEAYTKSKELKKQLIKVNQEISAWL